MSNKIQKLVWKGLHYLSLLIFILSCTIYLPFEIVSQDVFSLVMKWSAKLGMLLLAILLISKNVNLLLENRVVRFVKQTIMYQRDMGLSIFYLFAIHSNLAIYLIFHQKDELVYQVLSALIPTVVFLFLWITSYKNVQKRISTWKTMQSIVWLIIPLISLHEFILNKSLSLLTIFSLGCLIISVMMGIAFSKKKDRNIRQLNLILIGVIFLIIQFSVTKVIESFRDATLMAQKKNEKSVGSGEDTTAQASPKVEVVKVKKDDVLKNGTYTGSARGYAGTISVSVKVKAGNIADVEILSENETPEYIEKAKKLIPDRIVKKKATTIDTVSGATLSSNGIIEAVETALAYARK